MSDQVGRLKQRVTTLEQHLATALHQVSEANLKLLYVMRFFKVAQTAPGANLTDAKGQPLAPPKVMTLEDAFAIDRERFVKQLLAENEEHQRVEAAAKAEREAKQPTNGNARNLADAAHESGQQPTAGPPAETNPGHQRRAVH